MVALRFIIAPLFLSDCTIDDPDAGGTGGGQGAAEGGQVGGVEDVEQDGEVQPTESMA
jgi:hypothetical protein